MIKSSGMKKEKKRE